VSIIASTALLAAEPLAPTSTVEAVVFWILGPVTVLAAVGVVVTPRAVYSAVFLAATMINLAALYIAQGALFLGVVQLVVYTGAVMMLFLFVVMLVGVDHADSLVEALRGQRVTAVVAGLGFGILLIGAVGNLSTASFASPAAETAGSTGNVEGLAALIFTRYLWAFELTSALLITAALSAMVLAHRERLERRKSQRELADERFQPGGHATPMPAPGVYARHNAVDIPARLADGTFSGLSVSRTTERRGLVLTLLVATDTEPTSKASAEERAL
jgi:NADH-quinone oxidoreductase subunit J